LIGVLGTIAVWVDVVISKPAGRNLGFVWMFAGIVFYYAYRKRQEISATSRVELEKMEIPEYKEQPITKILVPTRGENFNTVQYAAKVAHSHGASLTALYVIEIPASLPLDTFFPDRLLKADTVIESSQAICREYGIPAKTLVLQSRSAGQAIYETARDGGYDLIILGTSLESPSRIGSRLGSALGSAVSVSSFLGSTVDYVLKRAPCRVWICAEEPRK
ncbi:MAG: universal stress protein, partial [Candidatus Omnitrophica bacterium]|nr:universal stress protein [Candidatus Omnitrophota bacterium]